MKGLTPKQAQALKLRGENNAVADIARKLKIDRKTVDNHLSVAIDKLGCPDWKTAYDKAVRDGLIEAKTPGS
ncbi:MAG TPA: helix-turn-helix transcriptional regulator [Candidatus Saccharimonadales bacterium]|nr:helix-turn-helix transcriptional regulator [Candidatus Saccharimonadales bacterium]